MMSMMPTISRPLKIFLITATSLLISVLVWRGVSKLDTATARATAEPRPSLTIEPVLVRTTVARTATLVQSLTATGTLDAVRKVQLNARLSAEIRTLYAREGHYFVKGDPIIRFNPRDYALACREADDEVMKAQLEYGLLKSDYANSANSSVDTAPAASAERLRSAEKTYQQAQTDFEKKQCSAADLRRAKENLDIARLFSGQRQDDILRSRSGLAKAQAAQERAQMNLENTVIAAPFTGYAVNLKVSDGQVVSSGQLCLEFVDIARVNLEVGILEKELPLIKNGNACVIKINAFPSEVFQGQVSAVSPVISMETKTAKAVIELSNASGRLKPGMSATAEIEAAFFKGRLVVPRTAVLERDGRKVVFVKEGNVAKWHYVETGVANETEIEIVQGIQAGDEVIVENNFSLSHDMPVAVTNFTEKSPQK